MKPRISRVMGYPGYSTSQLWWCTGGGAQGVGSSPLGAYQSWQQYCRDMQNVNRPGGFTVQNIGRPPTDQLPWWQRWFGGDS